MQLKKSFLHLSKLITSSANKKSFQNQSEFSNSSAIMEKSFQNLSKSRTRSASRKSFLKLSKTSNSRAIEKSFQFSQSQELMVQKRKSF